MESFLSYKIPISHLSYLISIFRLFRVSNIDVLKILVNLAVRVTITGWPLLVFRLVDNIYNALSWIIVIIYWNPFWVPRSNFSRYSYLILVFKLFRVFNIDVFKILVNLAVRVTITGWPLLVIWLVDNIYNALEWNIVIIHWNPFWDMRSHSPCHP